jgi:high affinity Mn2+ porin
MRSRIFLGLWLSCAMCVASTGYADAPGSPPDEEPARTADATEPDGDFDFMHLLARHGLHDLSPEHWNAYGQMTFIGSLKLPFSARYTNFGGSMNSLVPQLEESYTGTATLFVGLALWRGAELYAVPEVISELPLSQLRGLGGVIQNFELQKQGTEVPTPYLSRVYMRQTFGLGGTTETRESAASQLAGTVDHRRLVFTVGNFSILDFFDKNSVLGDPRRGFFNMAFLTNSAYDFAADARGYAWGGVAELFYDDWAVRFGRITPPQQPNQLALDFRIYEFYGDQAELEHHHKLLGQPGAIRVLGFRNEEYMGRFDDAIAAFKADPAKNANNAQTECPGNPYAPGDPYAGPPTQTQSSNAAAPDLCWVRRPNVKLGIGIAIEQRISDSIGIFARGMYSDGQTEVYSYTSTDRSVSAGAVVTGAPWHRHDDTVGVGYGLGWISGIHAQYLAMGGIDGFLGDGKLNASAEQVLDVFYSFHVVTSLWASADYQHITNPGFNADRGPVDIFGARLHAEF